MILGVLSCQKEDMVMDFANDPTAVKVEASVGGSLFTRSNPTDDTKQNVFNADDQIALSNGGAFIKYAYNGTAWSAVTASEYLRWDADQMTFEAYYPTTAGTSMSTFTLPADQSTPAKIALADYMRVSTSITKEGVKPVSLELERQTARVIVKIGSFGDQYGTSEQTVSNVKILSGSTEVLPYNQNGSGKDATFTALVMPTNITVSGTLITLTDGQGNQLTVKAPSTMAAGNSYTYTLHVGKDAAVITSVTVEDWVGKEKITGDTEIDYAEFDDQRFSKYLNNEFTELDFVDGKLPLTAENVAKMKAITEMNVPKDNIKSLKGIEYFTGLEKLTCIGNQLTSLDVTKNIALQHLDCSKNLLSELDFSKNIALMYLHCDGNEILTKLDVTKNTALMYLDCCNNKLTELNLSANTVLTYLDCSHNQLTVLDIPKNTTLTTLYCNRNWLNILDVTPCSSLPGINILCGYQMTNGITLRQLTLTLTATQNETFNPTGNNSNVTTEVAQ